jgi:hypothetical protein
MQFSNEQTAAAGDEILVRLSAAPRIVRAITGESPSVATIYRWAQRGLRDVRLRTAYAGGHRRTCERWVREFFAAVSAAAGGSDAGRDSNIPPALSRRRAADVAQAAAYLDQQGI